MQLIFSALLCDLCVENSNASTQRRGRWVHAEARRRSIRVIRV